MSRVKYLPLDLAEPAQLVDAIRQRRGGELSNLDRLLLHSPPLAGAWNGFLGSVRTQLKLSGKLREIGMCGVAVLNGAEYEFFHHAPLFVKEGGTQAQVEAMRDVATAMTNDKLFDAAERAALKLTYEMTRTVTVKPESFAEAEKAFGSTQILVEMIAVISVYNMVSRFLVAIDVKPENQEH